MGVRIFPDGRNPTDKTSNAVNRRLARGQRRRRDRYLQRRRDLMQALIEYGLMPEDAAERKCLEKQDPYELRARALDEPLRPYQLGRALFHLNQRRGFKSNRKAEKDDSNTGPAKVAAKNLDERMSASNARTLGGFLYRRQRAHDPVRFRNLSTSNKAEYEFYPTRQMILDEFDAIWAEQVQHHANVMTAEAKDTLRKIISDQRPIESPPVGKCTLDPASDNKDAEGFRCSWAHPLAQRFRIWQEVRNLEAQETGRNSRPLSKEEGDAIAAALLESNKVSFDRIRRLLNLPSEVHFNLESEKRKELAGDKTAAKLSGKKFFGKTWRGFPLEKQIKIVDHLLDEPDESTTLKWLAQHAQINGEAAGNVASAFLPEGHCHLGLRTIRNILPHMKAGMNYPEAARSAGYDHVKPPTGELSLDGFLPYYGEWLKDHLAGSGDPQDPVDKRYGRYPNPTIHVALGQLRRVVNALITEYGPPHQVVIEVTRDLKRSKKQREEIAKEQAANQKKNDDRNKKLTQLGQQSNSRNRLKLRLWEELNPKNPCDRRCPFTGEIISMARLFSDDNQVEIEHLIPFSYSYDDSAANKVVALTRANRQKGKCTPFEAFGQTPEWEDIIQRAAKLPHNKRWRFLEDARRRFDEQDGFLARQLNETGWLARMTKEYLTAVVSPNNIWVSPGRLTDIIRAKWGLKTLLPDPPPGEIKNRNDHRHHAIDAFVVALTDRSLLQRMSSAYDETRSRIRVPEPWEGFDRNQLKPFLDKLVVSYKPDHGTRGVKGKTTGQLHNEMAYGLINFAGDNASEVVVRRPLPGQGTGAITNREGFEAVRNLPLKVALLDLWDKVHADNDKAIAFAQRVKTEGIRPKGHPKEKDNVKIDYDFKKRCDVAKATEQETVKAKLWEEWDKIHSDKTKAAKFGQLAATKGVMVNGLCQQVRRVRVVEWHRVIPIKDRRPEGAGKPGKPYKPYLKGYQPGGNEFADVWEMRDGSWQMVVVSTFDANQPDFDIEKYRPTTSKGKFKGKPDPTAKRLMRLYKGDMGVFEGDANFGIVHIREIVQPGRVLVEDHRTRTNQKRYRAEPLRKAGFRKVKVNEIGKMPDPLEHSEQ